MAVNKLIINGEVKFDLSKDTVDSSSLLKGVTAHNANGIQITGTLNPVSSPFDEYLRETVDTDINRKTKIITQIMDEGTVTTTFSNQNGTKTITSKIVPNTGTVNYTRITTISKENNITKIRENLTTTNK